MNEYFKQPNIKKIIAVKDLSTYLGIHPESRAGLRRSCIGLKIINW